MAMFENVVESAKQALNKAEEKVREGVETVEEKLRGKDDANPEQQARPEQPKGGQNEDAVELLTNDHALIASLFDQIESLKDKGQDSELRDGLYAQLQWELEAHADAEEKAFYPVVEKEANLRLQIIEARQDHDRMRKLVKELDALKSGSEAWADKLNELRETVETHVDKEEDEIFPAARQALGEARLMRIGAELEQIKETLTKKEGKRAGDGKSGKKTSEQRSGKSGSKAGAKPKGRSGKSGSTRKIGRQSTH